MNISLHASVYVTPQTERMCVSSETQFLATSVAPTTTVKTLGQNVQDLDFTESNSDNFNTTWE